jgi:undecaprenyl pyrophosphate synthase
VFSLFCVQLLIWQKIIKWRESESFMFKTIIKRDIYEIGSKNSSLNGVMLRGRIRKLCLENQRNVLVENTEDLEKQVRFAVPVGEDVELIIDYLRKIISDVQVKKVEEDILCKHLVFRYASNERF